MRLGENSSQRSECAPETHLLPEASSTALELTKAESSEVPNRSSESQEEQVLSEGEEADLKSTAIEPQPFPVEPLEEVKEPVLSPQPSEEPPPAQTPAQSFTSPLPSQVPPLTSSEEMLHGMPKNKLFQEFPGEFKSLEQYALSLLESSKWRAIGERQGLVTKKLNRSKFNTEVPVFQCNMDFQEPIPAEFILNMFDDPDYRMHWDTRITQMNKIYQPQENGFLHYHVIHFNAPLEDRDFLVKYFIRMQGNETRVIFKSVTHPVALT